MSAEVVPKRWIAIPAGKLEAVCVVKENGRLCAVGLVWACAAATPKTNAAIARIPMRENR
jgi:hypothetical protein